jgi:hypothetical protein
MTLSPQARRYARRLARNSFRVKPNEAEVAAMRAIIGDDQTFVRLAPVVQRIVFVGIMKARAMRSFTDDYNEIRNATRRKREAVTLQSALDRLLKILDVENMPRSEHLSLVARVMEARLGISFEAVAEKLEDFGETARNMFDASKSVTSAPATRRRALKEDVEMDVLLDALERAGVAVGITGGKKGGPGTRLLQRLIKCTSGQLPTIGEVKKRLVKAIDTRKSRGKPFRQVPTPRKNV